MTSRTEAVRSPSSRQETIGVARASVVVAITCYLVVATRAGGNAGGAAGLMPFQVLFRNLASPIQRTYRQMTEGTLDIEQRLAGAARFPEPAMLAEEGIPPFVADPIARPALSWRLQEEPWGATYVGTPDRPGASFLIQILRAAPGEPTHAGIVRDEGHRRLPDGTILHVSFWVREYAAAPPTLINDPARVGYQQIMSRLPDASTLIVPSTPTDPSAPAPSAPEVIP